MNFKANLLKKLTIVLVLILVSGTAFAASGETLVIGGAVPLILTLNVTPTEDADNLDLSSATGSTSVVLASLDISTNNTAGWELIIYSVNDARLINDDTDEIAYTLTYAGLGTTGAVAPTSTTATVYGEVAGAATADTANLSINYNQDENYPAGFYSDQLSIVLRAK